MPFYTVLSLLYSPVFLNHRIAETHMCYSFLNSILVYWLTIPLAPVDCFTGTLVF